MVAIGFQMKIVKRVWLKKNGKGLLQSKANKSGKTDMLITFFLTSLTGEYLHSSYPVKMGLHGP